MSKRATKLPATNGWRAPNGQMAPLEPSKFAPVTDETGVLKQCARCGRMRRFGTPCADCEWRALEAQ
jgi:hypothetical protein